MSIRSCSLGLGLLACWTPFISAQNAIGFRQLTSTHPVAVQVGKSATIQVRSNFTLDGAHTVLFDRPGIKMTYAETKGIDAPATARTSVGTPFRFNVEVPADQPPGLYEFRVATKKAVSSVGQLLVTELPVVNESGQNGTPATANPVTIPATICGTCEAIEDVDCFRFAGQAGQEITAQVYAQRVTDRLHNMVVGNNIYLMDPILTLYGPNGQVVVQNDNYLGGDSFFHCKLPTSGDYVLEVRDVRYAGNPRYTYCVEVSDRPFAQSLYPMAVRIGESAEVEVVGRMLGGPARTKVTAGTQLGWTTHRAETPRGLANAAPLLVSPHPQVMELEAKTNNISAEATPVTLPAGINGRIAAEEDVDYWSFTAKKGQIIRLEVDARRRGSPLDSVIEIYAADGKKLAEHDDIPGTKDSKLLWTAPADGTYFVAIRDLLGRGGPDYVYHLWAEPAEPDFELHGEYYYAMLAPGTSMIWFARIERLNGFDGPVAIDVEGLPPGVTLAPVTIPKGMNHCALILTAKPDAQIGAALVRTVGRATVPSPDGKGLELIRQGRVTCEQQAGGGGQLRWPIDTQLVGITEPLDLTKVVATPNAITLKPGEKATIQVKIERNAGFTDPVALDMAFSYFATTMGQQLPPNVRVAPESKLRLSGKILEGTVVLEALPNALPVEKLPIAVLARVSISFSITTNYCSNPIELTVLGK